MSTNIKIGSAAAKTATVNANISHPVLYSIVSSKYDIDNIVQVSIKYKVFFDNVQGKDDQTIVRLYYSDFFLLPSLQQLQITYQFDDSQNPIPYTPFYNGLINDAFGSIGPGNDQYAIYYRIGTLTPEEVTKVATTLIQPINNVSSSLMIMINQMIISL